MPIGVITVGACELHFRDLLRDHGAGRSPDGCSLHRAWIGAADGPEHPRRDHEFQSQLHVLAQPYLWCVGGLLLLAQPAALDAVSTAKAMNIITIPDRRALGETCEGFGVCGAFDIAS